MAKTGRRTDVSLKENIPVQAVVVLDDFEGEFDPLTWMRPKALVPLLTQPLVDQTLSFLQVRGVQEAFVYCSRQHNLVARHIRTFWSSAKMEVHVVVSETYHSLGDVMRDVDRQGKVKSDFILIRGDVVGSINLLSILEEHRLVLLSCRLHDS